MAYDGKGPLSPRMRRFADVYAGNGKAAAIAAGFAPSNARHTGSRLLADPRIATIIQKREAKVVRATIMSRLELQEWWSATARDPNVPLDERRMASTLLARSFGMFLDRVQVDASATLRLPDGLTVETLETLARGEPMPVLPSGDPDDGADPH